MPGRDAAHTQVQHRADIDGLRAVAILAVVGFHALPRMMPGGFVGVDIFFVISGYLITGIITRDLRASRFSLADFYARRVRRIFPALIVVLAVVWIVGWLLLLPDEYRRLGKAMSAGAGFMANLSAYKDVGAYFYNTQQQPLIHLWSLGVEEQFYLFWPLLLLALWRFGSAALVLLTAVTLSSFAVNVATVPWDTLGAFYLPWNRLWELAMGGMLAYAQLRRHKFARVGAPTKYLHWLWTSGHHLAGFFGSALIIGSVAGLRGSMEFPGWWAVLPAAGSLLLIAAGPYSWINRHVLSLRAMVFIGLISYPLYLWHWPLLAFCHVTEGEIIAGSITGCAIAASFLLAYLTYKYVETPIRRSPQGTRRVPILCGCLGLCLAVGLLVLVKAFPSREVPPAVLPLARAGAEDWLPGTDTAWTPIVDEFVVIGDRSRRALFIGDSHVQQYYPRIERLIREQSGAVRGAVFAVRGSCPPIPELAGAYGKSGCRKHIQGALDYARMETVDTVVLGAAWASYFVEFRANQYVLKAHSVYSLEKLRQLVTDFRARGKRVYLILPSPTSPLFDPRRRIRRTLLPPGFEPRPMESPKRADVEARLAPIASQLRRLAAETGAGVIDPMNFLCAEDRCSYVSASGEIMYHDRGHLTPAFVRQHIKFFDEIILENRAALLQ